MTMRRSEKFLLLLSGLACLYFAGEAALFLWQSYFHPLVLWLLLINLAISGAVIWRHRIFVVLCLLRFVVAVSVYMWDVARRGGDFISLAYLDLLSSDAAFLATFVEAMLRQAFGIWLLLFSVYLYRKGALR